MLASRDTRKDGGAHVGNTLRMAVPDAAPTGVPSARTPVDRGALTHSEEPVALVAPPTGTDPMPLQQGGPALGDPRIRVVGDRHVLVDDAPSPASPRPKSFCPPAAGGTTSSAAGVAMFPRDTGPAPAPPGVRRGLLRLALVSVAAAVAVVSVALLTLSGRRDPTPSLAQAQPVVSSGTLPAPSGPHRSRQRLRWPPPQPLRRRRVRRLSRPPASPRLRVPLRRRLARRVSRSLTQSRPVGPPRMTWESSSQSSTDLVALHLAHHARQTIHTRICASLTGRRCPEPGRANMHAPPCRRATRMIAVSNARPSGSKSRRYRQNARPGWLRAQLARSCVRWGL